MALFQSKVQIWHQQYEHKTNEQVLSDLPHANSNMNLNTRLSPQSSPGLDKIEG